MGHHGRDTNREVQEGAHLGLDVPMHDAIRVGEIESPQEFIHVEAAIKVGEVGIEVLVGGVVDEFEDEAGCLRVRVAHYVNETHYVRSAVEVLQDLDFAPIDD